MIGKEDKPIMIIRNLSDKDNVKPYIELNNALIEEKEELQEKLTKYKKAFEILKEFNDLPPLEEFVYCKEENYYYVEIDEYDDNLETYKTLIYTLGKEEYELLEELMKDENS